MLSGLLPSDYILNLSFGYSKINKFGKFFFRKYFSEFLWRIKLSCSADKLTCFYSLILG